MPKFSCNKIFAVVEIQHNSEGKLKKINAKKEEKECVERKGK